MTALSTQFGEPRDPPHLRSSDFVEFYHGMYGRLASQVYAFLGDAAEAEDVVQEAFLRAWQRWRRVREYDDPAGWVRRVAMNLATSRWRRLAAGGRAYRRHGRPADAPPLDPDHVALVAALRTLPPNQRMAVVLHYIADLSVADVAVELDVPRNTVLSWLHRARAQLAVELQGGTDE